MDPDTTPARLASGHGGTGGGLHPAPGVSEAELDPQKKPSVERNEAARWQFLVQLQRLNPYKVVLFIELEGFAACIHRVARVGPALKAHHKMRVWGEKVGNFTLTLVAPLRAQNSDSW